MPPHYRRFPAQDLEKAPQSDFHRLLRLAGELDIPGKGKVKAQKSVTLSGTARETLTNTNSCLIFLIGRGIFLKNMILFKLSLHDVNLC